jgi:hypothetical protein
MHDYLHIDVVHLILCFLPDLRTLNSAIQVSQRVYGIYKAYSRSILAAVAREEAGPALVQALRLAFAQRRRVASRVDHDALNAAVMVPEEDEVDAAPADWLQAQILSKNARAMRKLEIFYSRRCEGHPRVSTVPLTFSIPQIQRAWHVYLRPDCFRIASIPPGSLSLFTVLDDLLCFGRSTQRPE